ncbi:hypothetical protein [uncultured Psychromonas sp.]|uniref:hypothetical protein n=1 Tax=uncultured Psychromonas sp. TaxID=173974 RepID=UPI002635943A|nr:hypothetical protein [uncultured Psychromonas sp.]
MRNSTASLYNRGLSMHLEFYAQEVYYAGEPDGDIINVSFQEYPDPEIDYTKKKFDLPPSVKGIFFSVNYEFPPSQIKVDWCDGEEESGGELIIDIELTKTSLKIVLSNNYSFNVSFETDDVTFQNIKSFLTV